MCMCVQEVLQTGNKLSLSLSHKPGRERVMSVVSKYVELCVVIGINLVNSISMHNNNKQFISYSYANCMYSVYGN